MRELIIGSTAMRELGVGNREPKDLDVFADSNAYGVGHLKKDPFWDDRLAEWLPEGTHRFATLDELYTIKVSHSYWDLKNGSWDKHMSDIVALKNAGAKLDMDLHKLLYSIWSDLHGKKTIDLNQDKAMFFDDVVPRKYDHDSVHYSVAYGDHPMWEEVLVPGQEIAMDMKAIKALDFEDQVKLYREEIYATALERWVIPSEYTISPRMAYARAVKKTITNLTKGWSARFLVEHYETFRTPDFDYVARHRSQMHKLIAI